MINILMIEDDPQFSLFLGEYLEKYNIKITNFQDPFLGLSSGVDTYDLLILDLTLPGMDGLEVCSEVTKNMIFLSSSQVQELTPLIKSWVYKWEQTTIYQNLMTLKRCMLLYKVS